MKNTEFKKSTQLCWTCRRIFSEDMDECSWLTDGKPVEGWEATPTICDTAEGITTRSFCIINCPLYEEMKMRYEKRYDPAMGEK